MRIAPCDDPGVVNQNRTPAHRGFRPVCGGLRPVEWRSTPAHGRPPNARPGSARCPAGGPVSGSGPVRSSPRRAFRASPPERTPPHPFVDRTVPQDVRSGFPGSPGRAGFRLASPLRKRGIPPGPPALRAPGCSCPVRRPRRADRRAGRPALRGRAHDQLGRYHLLDRLVRVDPSMASISSCTTAVPMRRGFRDRVVTGGSVLAYTVDSLQQTRSRSSGTRSP